MLRYANAKPTPRSWQKVALGPFAKDIMPKGAEPPSTPFGVKSLLELEENLAAYRAFLTRVINQTNPTSIEAADLARELAAKAKLEVGGFGWDERTKRLTVRWNTKHQSFTEMLYAYLALALRDYRFDALFQCPACGKFDWQDTERRQKYYSTRCRNEVMSIGV